MNPELEANYAGTFTNRLGFGERPALILVDFVKAYFSRDCELFADPADALASALRIRDAARSLVPGMPIVYTHVRYSANGENGGRFFQKVGPLRHFIDGSEMGAWADGIDVANHEVVLTKQYASAFFGTSLAPMLVAGGIDTLIITGLTTSGCVRATCVDCVSHGFIPIVVREACGDRHRDPHLSNLFDMDAKYGDVVSEEEVMTYIRRISPA